VQGGRFYLYQFLATAITETEKVELRRFAERSTRVPGTKAGRVPGTKAGNA